MENKINYVCKHLAREQQDTFSTMHWIAPVMWANRIDLCAMCTAVIRGVTSDLVVDANDQNADD